jgi:hypothetical protein
MRSIKVEKFDAVITIFNAIGDLDKKGFVETIRNVHDNLNSGGIYIFDILNLDYLKTGNNITKLTIDDIREDKYKKVRKVQHSFVNEEGILVSFTTNYFNNLPYNKEGEETISTLQCYTAKELQDKLLDNGFSILRICTIDGSEFLEKESERILVVGKKIDKKNP